MWALYLVFFPIVAWLLPGWSISRWAYPRATALERLATAVLFGCITVVPAAYLPVYLVRTPISPFWILGSSVLITIVFVVMQRRWPRQNPPQPVGQTSAQSGIVAASVCLLAIYSALSTTPRSYEAVTLWGPCPHESAMFMLEDGRGGGLSAYDPSWKCDVTHLTSRPTEPGFGLGGVLINQRIGSMATISQAVAFHGSGGLVVIGFCYDLMVLALGALLLAQHLRHWWQVIPLLCFFGAGVRDVSGYMVNENVLAFGLSLGVFSLLVRRKPDAVDAAFAGCCLALCIGARPIAVSFLPACLLMLWPPRRSLTSFSVALVVFAMPWLITNTQVFGDPLHHPSLQKVATQHTVLGYTFEFHPLNWPISDTLLRPEFEPFPLMFQLPLSHLSAFGVLFWMLVAVGAFVVGWRSLIRFCIWCAPNYLMLLLIVSLDGEKASYALLSFAPLPLLAGMGLNGLFDNSLTLKRKAGACVLVLCFALLMPMALEGMTFEVDTRPQYNNAIGVSELTLSEKKALLLSPNWGPSYREETGVAWSLLTHGRPPQQPVDKVIDEPVFVWRDSTSLKHKVTMSLSEQPRVPPLLGNFQQDWNNVINHGAVSLLLRSSKETVDVTFEKNGEVVNVFIDTGGGTEHRGYINLALIDVGLSNIQQFDITVDGFRLRPSYYIMEWDNPAKEVRREVFIQMVSNHEWHHAMDNGQLKLVEGPGPSTLCNQRVYREFKTGHAPDTVLWSDGNRSIRLRKVSKFPPPPSPNTCNHVAL